MDYGAPIGFRLAVRHPDRVTALVVQNGNAYDEGLSDFWDPLQRYWDAPTPANGDGLRSQFAIDAVRWQYTHGVRDPEAISPDNWTFDQHLLDRPGNQEIQLALFYDYRTNVELYPVFQAYFREHQPPTLLVWGARDDIFPPEGARAYQRDLNGAELHLLDTGHFALEEDGAEIARLMLDFLGRHLSAAR